MLRLAFLALTITLTTTGCASGGACSRAESRFRRAASELKGLKKPESVDTLSEADADAARKRGGVQQALGQELSDNQAENPKNRDLLARLGAMLIAQGKDFSAYGDAIATFVSARDEARALASKSADALSAFSRGCELCIVDALSVAKARKLTGFPAASQLKELAGKIANDEKASPELRKATTDALLAEARTIEVMERAFRELERHGRAAQERSTELELFAVDVYQQCEE